MSAASEVNLKQTLRKIEYPLCAKEALNKIGRFKNLLVFMEQLMAFIFS